ncbi:MAG: homoserine O-succinyltransferase [Myxococcales bacterium]|nr:homoserine O-succinyltransferase [Polyangiaceae bacterium]MDW8248272.1 homoserine O-succinyltransferase [Myxococcales bacterium]
MNRPLRIGVINLMPRLETYEPSLRAALSPPGFPQHCVELVGIRLASHGYRSSDPEYLRTRYRSYDEVTREAALDGLLLTGAPVETLDFSAVHYWEELAALLRRARREVPSTLGLCWGAMALASLEGIDKVNLPQKVFGVFEHVLSPEGRAWLPSLGATYRCAQSRHAGLDDTSVTQAIRDGRVLSLARSNVTGHTLLISFDRRVVMHLGHPEYEPSRIIWEWDRDRRVGRPDVAPPVGFDVEGRTPTLPWEADSRAFFQAWISGVLSSSRAWTSPSANMWTSTRTGPGSCSRRVSCEGG